MNVLGLSKTLCLKILSLLLPPTQILVYHKSYSIPTKSLIERFALNQTLNLLQNPAFPLPLQDHCQHFAVQ